MCAQIAFAVCLLLAFVVVPSTLYCIRWLFICHSSMVPVEKTMLNSHKHTQTQKHTHVCTFTHSLKMLFNAAPIFQLVLFRFVGACSYETNACLCKRIPNDWSCSSSATFYQLNENKKQFTRTISSLEFFHFVSFFLQALHIAYGSYLSYWRISSENKTLAIWKLSRRIQTKVSTNTIILFVVNVYFGFFFEKVFLVQLHWKPISPFLSDKVI